MEGDSGVEGQGDWPISGGGGGSGHGIDKTFQLIGGVVQAGVIEPGAFADPGDEIIDFLGESAEERLVFGGQSGKECREGNRAGRGDGRGELGLRLETLLTEGAQEGAVALDRVEGGYDGRSGAGLRVQEGEEFTVMLKFEAERFNQWFDMFGHQSVKGERARPCASWTARGGGRFPWRPGG